VVGKELSEEERKKFSKKFLADLDKRDARISDVAIDFEVLLLYPVGTVRQLDARYRFLRLSPKLSRHRLVVVEKDGVVSKTVEDFILHETRGSRISAWRLTTDGVMAPYRSAALSHRSGGTALTLEMLLPFDHSRYRADYRGEGFRDGRKADVFIMNPSIRGGTKIEVAYRRKELLPCRWRAYRGAEAVWGAVGASPRIRDGMHVLERRTVEFAGTGESAAIRVRSRVVNRGVEASLFDPIPEDASKKER
jgi:hypothetical protein